MKTLLKFTIAFFILISCEKMDQPDLSYDCFIKSTVFDSNNEMVEWSVFYFKNGNSVKQEGLYKPTSETKYDNKGNVICFRRGNDRTEYEYNSDNKVTKEIYFIDNQTDYYISYIYKDTLVDKTYRINSANDTISYTYYYYNPSNTIDSVHSDQGSGYYYYNSANELDSVIFDKENWYYYYTADTNTLIITNNERMIEMEFIKKYENGRMVYYEYRIYDEQGQVSGYQIKTSEFNDEGLLAMTTEEYFQPPINTTPLTSYSTYFYEEAVLTKIETFDNNDILHTYTLIENTCK